jgi:hypothetical protein
MILLKLFIAVNILMGIAIFLNNPRDIDHLTPKGVMDGFITTLLFLPRIMTIMFLHLNNWLVVDHAEEGLK